MNIKVVSEDVLPPVMGTTDPLFVVAENSLDPSEMMTVASFASSDLLNPIPTAGRARIISTIFRYVSGDVIEEGVSRDTVFEGSLLFLTHHLQALRSSHRFRYS